MKNKELVKEEISVTSIASSELHTVAKLTEDVDEELEQDDPTVEHAHAIINGEQSGPSE